MTVIEALTLFAAAAAYDAPAVQADQTVTLGVAATVVRPAEVSTVTNGQVDLVTIENSAEAEVLAERGTVTRLDEDTTAVVADAEADSVVVTIVY